MRNESSSSAHCRQLINNLYQSSPLYLFETEEERGGGVSSQENASENIDSENTNLILSSLPHTDMVEAIEGCWREVIKQYWREAKGPKVRNQTHTYLNTCV